MSDWFEGALDCDATVRNCNWALHKHKENKKKLWHKSKKYVYKSLVISKKVQWFQVKMCTYLGVYRISNVNSVTLIGTVEHLYKHDTSLLMTKPTDSTVTLHKQWLLDLTSKQQHLYLRPATGNIVEKLMCWITWILAVLDHKVTGIQFVS
jgi:hypothetical protein